MQQPQWHEATADPPETEWATQIPLLKQEIARLESFLSDIENEEAEADQQIQSLTYALELTKSEAVRRRRSNNELQDAYKAAQTTNDNSHEQQAQSLEAELLNAKRDAANMVYEIKQLEFNIRRGRQYEAHRSYIYEDVMSPRSPASSPRISFGTPSLTSPGSRPSRLIGDVDALVRVRMDDDDDNEESAEHFGMCRLGVSAGGHIAIYSYASAEPLAHLDERVLSSEPMDQGDVEALRKALDSMVIRVDSEQYSLCGLREAVLSCKQLIERS